jgi:hypothetical protein
MNSSLPDFWLDRLGIVIQLKNGNREKEDFRPRSQTGIGAKGEREAMGLHMEPPVHGTV